MLSHILMYLSSLIPALLAMSFYTLMERKFLGYSQLRKGPNKVSVMGILQPMSDALKLFTKELNLPTVSNVAPFIVAPMINLILSLVLWSIMPSPSPFLMFSFSLMFFLCISSLNVYTTLVAGWVSNSKYSLLGALRSVAQTISYEVTMALILIWILLFTSTYNMQKLFQSTYFSVMLVMPIMSYIWIVVILAETNRTPFDLTEGESELVSGFNTEYSSGLFAMLFMAEYMNMMILSIFTTSMLITNQSFMYMSEVTMTTKALIMMMLFLWSRATLPRMRYDRLMNLTWMSFLPISLTCLIMTTNII
uniref:NADH-ubiquinone oxidoreductase chain 1 n=1 Tax=Ramisyllis multicaudata TaxID=1166726 RepID=A0A0K0YD70_RAMMU|nr:NADH dehydrogenase subunit 1 [Ramisyllis multicaudata]AKS48919.1 NADH dehydrogenase subunit 1 [Ramisyllis multicaudata]